MERLTPKERIQVLAIVMEEGQFASLEVASDWLTQVETWARELHRLYEAGCNRPRTQAEERREEYLETELKGTFKDHRLGLYLNSDPRGNPVGILTPKTGKYNTMGGAECGWRL